VAVADALGEIAGGQVGAKLKGQLHQVAVQVQ
jgi:hypothetical protein